MGQVSREFVRATVDALPATNRLEPYDGVHDALTAGLTTPARLTTVGEASKITLDDDLMLRAVRHRDNGDLFVSHLEAPPTRLSVR